MFLSFFLIDLKEPNKTGSCKENKIKKDLAAVTMVHDDIWETNKSDSWETKMADFWETKMADLRDQDGWLWETKMANYWETEMAD